MKHLLPGSTIRNFRSKPFGKHQTYEVWEIVLVDYPGPKVLNLLGTQYCLSARFFEKVSKLEFRKLIPNLWGQSLDI